MAFLLTLRRRFVADHAHEPPYFVEARHGHNWEVEATARLSGEDQEGPFAAALDAWAESVDYSLLNEQGALARRNPTAELLAQWALEALQAGGVDVDRVRIREKANYWAQCRPARP